MADVGPRASRVTIALSPTVDGEITCIICGRPDVEFEFASRAQGRRSFHGIHAECAKSTGKVEEL
jgi:hypothetical protein